MADTLLDRLSSQMGSIKAQLDQGGFSGAVKQGLLENQDVLQGWYNKVLEQKGVLTAAEKEQLLATLESSAKKNALAESAITHKRRMVIVGIISLVLITGLVVYIKVKNKKG